MDDQNSDQSFLSGTNATFINDLYKEANKIKEDFHQIVQKRWTRDLPPR